MTTSKSLSQTSDGHLYLVVSHEGQVEGQRLKSKLTDGSEAILAEVASVSAKMIELIDGRASVLRDLNVLINLEK